MWEFLVAYEHALYALRCYITSMLSYKRFQAALHQRMERTYQTLAAYPEVLVLASHLPARSCGLPAAAFGCDNIYHFQNVCFAMSPHHHNEERLAHTRRTPANCPAVLAPHIMVRGHLMSCHRIVARSAVHMIDESGTGR